MPMVLEQGMPDQGNSHSLLPAGVHTRQPLQITRATDTVHCTQPGARYS